MLYTKRGVDIPGISIQNNAKDNCYGNLTFTGKPGVHILIGSVAPTFERPVVGSENSYFTWLPSHHSVALHS